MDSVKKHHINAMFRQMIEHQQPKKDVRVTFIALERKLTTEGGDQEKHGGVNRIRKPSPT